MICRDGGQYTPAVLQPRRSPPPLPTPRPELLWFSLAPPDRPMPPSSAVLVVSLRLAVGQSLAVVLQRWQLTASSLRQQRATPRSSVLSLLADSSLAAP